jgi:diguanylate cyclase (GGDEF)-like protein
MRLQINQKGYWQGEIKNRRKSGEVYLQMLNITAIGNQPGKVTHYIWIFSDIAQLNDIVTRLDFLAHHDPLTGLPNRLLLFARLEHCIALAKRERKSAALLMLDLDRFKHVNDSFGHFAGDELLKQVAQRLTSRLRGIDTVSRLGGDEFAILLEDLSHTQDSARLATEIIVAIGEPFYLSNGSEVRIGASVGISLFPEQGITSEEILQQADAALYRAKADGRGNFKYYSEDLTHAALRRNNLESLLRRAVSGNELLLSYQPRLDISSGNIIGAEVLLSWHNSKEGVIQPSQFMPIAEKTGLILELGEWMLREACRQGQAWLAAGLPSLKLAVNLSPYQFCHATIVEMISDILRETSFPAEYLELELTESALMEREKESVLIFEKLRDLGVCLTIDNFGTGYSSLAYLKRFPLNMLKIDKTFIDDLPQQENDKEITTAIIGLGHTLGLKVLADGVETQEQLDFLREKGCDYYQGFYKSPSLTAEDFGKLFKGYIPQSKGDYK